MLEKKIEELPNRGEKKDKFSIYKRKKKQRKNTKAYKIDKPLTKLRKKRDPNK